jgi:hypothetical protein
MTVREVPPGPARRALIPLIRLAEDSESQLESAIDDGTMYVAEEGETPIGVVLVLDHGEQERELRYVAIAESHQAGAPYGAAYVRGRGSPRAGRLLVGTARPTPATRLLPAMATGCSIERTASPRSAVSARLRAQRPVRCRHGLDVFEL